MKDHLRIGELARLFHLDVQTLRLYESNGLLLPEGREPESNYRFYRSDQVYPLALIRYLRRLECPLGEIGSFMSKRSFTETCSYLRHQSEILRARYQELLRLDAVIQLKISFVERELQALRIEEMSVERLGPIRYFPLGDLSEVFSNELFYLYPTLAFYRGDKQDFGAYLIGGAPENCEQPICTMPAGKYVTGYHKGAFQHIRETFARMRAAADLALSEEVVCINIIDQFVEVNEENYITKVLIRTRDADN